MVDGQVGSADSVRIAFRADASVQIGSGHVMRCLTLADALKAQGAECLFICRPHEGHLLDLIVQRGHPILTLPVLAEHSMKAIKNLTHSDWLGTDWATDALDVCRVLGGNFLDWLVVDHYALDFRWERLVRVGCKRLMAIDDLADRSHDCDVLLDQNLGRLSDDYARLLPLHAVTLIGPQYALLRPEFAKLRAQSLLRRASPQLKHLLISMGGVDKDNVTGHILESLEGFSLPADMQITVVMGSNSPWLRQVQLQAAEMRSQLPVQVLAGVGDMARIMVNSDLAIGAAGGMAWERCCLGVPSIVLILAENQQSGAMALQKIGAAIIINEPKQIREKLTSYFESAGMTNWLAGISQVAAKITDGSGVVRVIEEGFLKYV